MAEVKPPSGYDTDPRLSKTSSYDRQDCIAALDDLLDYLTRRLPYLEPAWIARPPKTGWANITPDRFAPLQKSDIVVDLLAHLPYVHVPDQSDPYSPHHSWAAIKRDTYLIDYHGAAYQTALDRAHATDDAQGLEQFQQPFIAVPPWVVCLTTGLKNGEYLLFDTSDGKIPLLFLFPPAESSCLP